LLALTILWSSLQKCTPGEQVRRFCPIRCTPLFVKCLRGDAEEGAAVRTHFSILELAVHTWLIPWLKETMAKKRCSFHIVKASPKDYSCRTTSGKDFRPVLTAQSEGDHACVKVSFSERQRCHGLQGTYPAADYGVLTHNFSIQRRERSGMQLSPDAGTCERAAQFLHNEQSE
jgi:hypothetical protein